MLLVLFTAVALRLPFLDQMPPGLYRDEAYNGLDALKVIDGARPLFFEANNGREPAYIYLTALSIALFGQTTFAVRLAAAVVGTLTTLPVWLLARSWFGPRVGLWAAFLWAITLWPVHLSRIGLRIVLLAPLLALAFWLGTLGFRRQKARFWLLSGVVYGLSFYTYLAVRFTPLLLAAVGLYLLLTGARRRLWPGVVWFGLGTAVVILPFALLILQQPDLILGRTGQVSVFHPDVSGGDPLGTLLRQIGAALGMFVWRGDTILRHNPAGRPVFDWLMAVPFLIGMVWCGLHWRRRAAAVTLLWTAVMLGPTILAADAPHFLRAAGVLPAALLLPAVGLERLWRWERLSRGLGPLLVTALLLGSLGQTLRDYVRYGRDTAVAYAFEAAARDLAEDINAQPAGSVVYLDERLWSGWPSLSFLVTQPERVRRADFAAAPPPPTSPPAALFAWPFESLDFVPQTLLPPARVTAVDGSLARGDRDATAYPLYVRYTSSTPDDAPPLARFGEMLTLTRADAAIDRAHDRMVVTLDWTAETAVDDDLAVFVHVVGPEGLIGQHDGPPGNGRWLPDWWQPGLTLNDSVSVALDEPFDPARHQVLVGVYRSAGGERLPVTDAAGAPRGDNWPVTLQ